MHPPFVSLGCLDACCDLRRGEYVEQVIKNDFLGNLAVFFRFGDDSPLNHLKDIVMDITILRHKKISFHLI